MRTGPHLAIEALLFEIPEVTGSAAMRSAVASWCDSLGIRLTTIDVWEEPEAVVAHEVLSGPAIVVLADGHEVGRLTGRCSERRLQRLSARIPDRRAVTAAA